jgi:predicted DNA-binding WGR domain protein
MKRRLEYFDLKSSKFCEVSVEDSTLFVRSGDLGSKGKVKEKKYASDQDAVVAAEKLIQEKLLDGYEDYARKSPSSAKKASSKLPRASSERLPVSTSGAEPDGMQSVLLSGSFRSSIPSELLKMIECENEFVYLLGDQLYVGYDLDVSRMSGTPFGKDERDVVRFIDMFEACFEGLSPFMKEDFTVYYFTYTGEYTATMWAKKEGVLRMASGWIGDFCRAKGDDAKNEFVDRHYPALKNGEIEAELATAMEKALRKVA